MEIIGGILAIVAALLLVCVLQATVAIERLTLAVQQIAINSKAIADNTDPANCCCEIFEPSDDYLDELDDELRDSGWRGDDDGRPGDGKRRPRG